MSVLPASSSNTAREVYTKRDCISRVIFMQPCSLVVIIIQKFMNIRIAR